MRDFINSRRAETLQNAALYTCAGSLAATTAIMLTQGLALTGLLIATGTGTCAASTALPLLRHALPRAERGRFPLAELTLLAVCAPCAVLALRPDGTLLTAAAVLLVAGTALLPLVHREETHREETRREGPRSDSSQHETSASPEAAD